MSDEQRGPELVRDDALTVALRAIYRAPADPAYWTGLEQRIMATVDLDGSASEAWWTVSDRWVRVGLFAAAATLVLAGGMLLREQAKLNQTMAVDAIVEVEGLESALAQREPISREQATLRKLTGHQ